MSFFRPTYEKSPKSRVETSGFAINSLANAPSASGREMPLANNNNVSETYCSDAIKWLFSLSGDFVFPRIGPTSEMSNFLSVLFLVESE